MVSAAMGDAKAGNAENCGAEFLTSTDPSCLMQIEGVLWRRVFETDLGEFIVQLRNEPPYHIVTPAMHLTRSDIAALFKEKLGGIDTDDPPQLVTAAREALRKAFFTAEMGITGANFLVAGSGNVTKSVIPN
jgi:L-lactate utilization protein LutB